MKQFLLFAVVFFSITCSYSQNGPEWHYVHYFDTNNTYGAISAIDQNIIYVMLDNGMFYKSTDGGLSWADYSTGVTENVYDMAFLDNNQGLAVLSAGTILKTTDGGLTWTSITSGTTDDLLSVEIISQNSIWIVGKNGTILHSTDLGNSWTMDGSLTSKRLNSVRFRNANEGYIAGNNGVLLHTTDGGGNWSAVSLSTIDDLFSLSLTENNTYLLAGTVNSSYHSFTAFQNDGANWTSYGISAQGGLGVSSLYFYNDNHGFYGEAAFTLCSCSFFYIHSIDSVQNHSLGYCGEDGDISHAYSDIAFVDENVGYALSGEILFKTSNGGTGWSQNPYCDFLPGENYAVEEFKLSAFSIYPNPSQGNKIKIEFENAGFGSFSVEIFDINGKQILYLEKMTKNSIDISALETGIYFLKILKNGKTIGSEKLIKNY